jgi:hypothetical protein
LIPLRASFFKTNKLLKSNNNPKKLFPQTRRGENNIEKNSILKISIHGAPSFE